MNVVNNLESPWVYVDDSDPAIAYSGPWVVDTGIPTGLDALTQPESTNTPAYGTLHSITFDNIFGSVHSFWYIFNGTDFSAVFRSVNSELLQHANCTIDGVPQKFMTVEDEQHESTTCFNENFLSSTSHNLSIIFPAIAGALEGTGTASMSFDWLAFNPLKAPQADADILYPMSPTNMAPLTFSLEFIGISAGVYGMLETDGRAVSVRGDPACSLLSYTIDSSPPVNATLDKPTHVAQRYISPQLILQTPPLSRQQHVLNVTCLKLGNNGSVPFFTAVVQNKTHSMDLTPFPSIINSTTSSKGTSLVSSTSGSSPTTSIPSTSVQTHNEHRINPGIIAAIAVGTFLVLLLIVFSFWKCIERKRAAIIQRDHRSIAEPFSAHDPAQIRRFRLGEYTTTEKTNKYRQAFGIATRDQEQLEDDTDGMESEQNNQAGSQPRRVRYRVHEDGGEVQHVEEGEASDDEDIVSLPPIYDTVERSRSQSNPASSEPTASPDIPAK